MLYSHVVPGSCTSGALAMPVTNCSGVIMRDSAVIPGWKKFALRVSRFQVRAFAELSVSEARRMPEEIMDSYLTLGVISRVVWPSLLGDNNFHFGERRQEFGHRIGELHPAFL